MSDTAKKILRAALAFFAMLARDLTGLAGAGLTLYGVWQVYRPAAFILAGGFLLFVALSSARRKSSDNGETS